jgi:hypothetical protein
MDDDGASRGARADFILRLETCRARRLRQGLNLSAGHDKPPRGRRARFLVTEPCRHAGMRRPELSRPACSTSTYHVRHVRRCATFEIC